METKAITKLVDWLLSGWLLGTPGGCGRRGVWTHPSCTNSIYPFKSSLFLSEQCGGTIFPNVTMNTTEGIYGSGYIQSPEYPSYYPSLLDCFWKIQAPSRYSLRVNFHELNIEDYFFVTRECIFDYLDIVNINSEGSILRYRLLG